MGRWIALSIYGLLLAGMLSSPVEAGNVLAWISGRHKTPTVHAQRASSIFDSRPSPHVYPEYNVNHPWYGYGFGKPSYAWGYFGARYRPAVIHHKGYYGDISQWGYRRGF